jgi:hypothetical protein
MFALGDVQRGVSLYAYQEEPPRIAQVARAFDAIGSRQSITSVEFLVSQLTSDAFIVSTDQLGNLLIHSYSPKHLKSQQGTRLVLRGAHRLPSPCHSLQRLLDRLFVYCVDGSISVLSLLDPSAAAYKRLSAIGSQLARSFPPLAGVSVRHSRLPRIPLYPQEAQLAMPRAVVEREWVGEQLATMASVWQGRAMAARAMVDFEQVKADLGDIALV